MVRPHIRFAEIALGVRAASTKVQAVIHPPLEGGSKFAIRKFRGGVRASAMTPPRNSLRELSASPQGGDSLLDGLAVPLSLFMVIAAVYLLGPTIIAISLPVDGARTTAIPSAFSAIVRALAAEADAMLPIG